MDLNPNILKSIKKYEGKFLKHIFVLEIGFLELP